METKINKQKSERAFIIAGLGDIGSAFARKLSEYGKVIGISRKPKNVNLDKYIQADLLEKEDVKKAFAEAFEEIGIAKEIVYLHLVGKFAFEDENHPIGDKNEDGIDDEIYETNVETFRNVKPYLKDYLIRNPLSKIKVIGIGSSSDIYEIPFWHSYTLAKNELRKEFRLMYGNPETFGRAGIVLINVTTVSGTQLSGERPFISRDFCLSPEEVVADSLDIILDDKVGCIELTIIKPNPKFSDPDYLDLNRIRERWYEDMHGKVESNLHQKSTQKIKIIKSPGGKIK